MIFNNLDTGELDLQKKSFEPEFLPNLFIIGAQKSGTTTISKMLSENSDVLFSTPKEPRFFEYEYPLGTQHYIEKYYKNYSGEKIICEARTTHLMIPFVPDRIKETSPNAKIVVILRNPIERAFSAWNHFRKMRPGREIRSVHEALVSGVENYNPRLWESERDYVLDLDPMGGAYHGAYIEGGCYYNLLWNWIGKFKEIKILFAQDLMNDKQNTYKDLCDFIGIECNNYSDYNLNVSNSYCISNIKLEHKYLYQMLRDFYKDDVESLSYLSNRDLSKEWLI